MTKHVESRGGMGLRTSATLVGVIAVLYLAREILIPLAFAITLALILTPAVAWLQKLRFARFPAVLLVMFVSIATAGWIGYVLFNQLVAVVSDLPSYQQNIHSKVQAMRTPGKSAFSRAAASVKELGKELSSDPAATTAANKQGKRTPPAPAQPVAVQVAETPVNEFEYVRELASPFLAPIGIFGMVLIFTVFLLVEQNDLRNRLFRLAGLERLNIMTQAVDDATRRVSHYLMLQMLVNAGFGVLCGAGLYLIGVPYFILWGTVAGILRIVPYAGTVIATALPLLLSLAVFDQWMPPLLVLLLFGTLELVVGNFVEPRLYGAHAGISSLALLFTTVFWAALWGPAGLILSTPLTVCVVVLGRHLPQLSFLHILLGDQPVLAPEAQVYQRLLAMDDHEARAVADAYLAENSLLQLYDSVFIPALAMAEQDRHKGALDARREEFVFLGVKEMITEYSEKAANAPAGPSGRVLCLAASDEADEITAAMLAQLLEQAGCAALSFPLDASLQQVLAVVEPGKDDAFFISALPPFAFARAKALSRSLQGWFPGTKIVVGVWGFSGDTERALQRFQPAHPERLVTNLAGAIEFFVGSGDGPTDDMVESPAAGAELAPTI